MFDTSQSFFLTVHSLSSLHVLNVLLSWTLSYQDLHMIALPGLLISILFFCRISYSILAHFIWSMYPLSHLLSILLISFKLLYFLMFYLHSIQYWGSVSWPYLWRYSSILQYWYYHIYTGILPYCSHTLVVILSYLHRYSSDCGSVTFISTQVFFILW